MSFSHGVDLDPFSNAESTDSDLLSPLSPRAAAASPDPIPASSAPADAGTSGSNEPRRNNSIPQYSLGAAFGPSPGFGPRETTRGSVFERERIISHESSASQLRSRAGSMQSNFDPEDGDFDNFIDQTTFEVAREFEPSSVAHKFTDKEREKMKVFETIDYWEPHTKIYKRHIETTPTPPLWAKWFAFFWIGAVVGIIAFVLKQTIDVTFSSRSKYTDELLEHKNAGTAWIFTVAHSCGLILISCCLCVFIEPVAAGSGVPEVMGYLNGVRIPRLLHFRVAVVKFLSCVTAVASGLPVGPEGPMIHLGACVGAGVSQGRSKTLRFTSSITRMFRNSQDKRDFITCGVAAGVSAAFSSPTGGLLFTMEELSSFWPRALTWRIFFGTMVSTFAVNLFMSAFHAWKYLGDIGKWSDEATILLNVHSAISFNVYAVPAVVLLGAICGVMAAVFNAVNLRISRLRLAYINTPYRRILEAVLITVVWTTIAFTLPYAVDCKAMETSDVPSPEDSKFEEPLRAFNCPDKEYNPLASLLLEPGHTAVQHLFSRQNSHQFGYASVALFFGAYFVFACISAGTAISSGLIIPTLVMGSSIGRLFGLAMVDIFGSSSDGTSMIDAGVFSLFGAAAFFSGLSRLTVSLVVIMVEMSNDTRLLLPVMLGIMVSKGVGDLCTHALYHALLEIKCVPFLDPEIALPKIECFSIKDVMARDVKSIPRVIQVRKLVEMLENCAHNGFPVVVPSIYKPSKPSEATLRRRAAKSPMQRGLSPSPSSPSHIALSGSRGSVVSEMSGRSGPSLSLVNEIAEDANAAPGGPKSRLAARSREPRQFKGMIRRSTLEVLLRHPKKPFFHKSKLKALQSSKADSLGSLDPNNPAFYSTRNLLSGNVAPVVSYSELVEFDEHEYALNKRRKIQGADSGLSKEVRNRAVIRESLSAEEMEMYMDLGPYIDTAAFCVPGDFSLQMAYLTFRHMGLRHLTVVNDEHEVIGIITRKDLIGQVIEERLRERQMERQMAVGGKAFVPGSSAAMGIPNSDSESSFNFNRIGPSASVYYRSSAHSSADGHDGLTAPLLSDPSMDS